MPNSPNVPQSDDDVVIGSGASRFVNPMLPGLNNATLTFLILSGDATNASIVEALNGGSLLTQDENWTVAASRGR